MERYIKDKDVRILVGLASTLEGDYVEYDDAWAGSPFAWIKTRPSRQRGKIGEQLVAGWCAAKGLDVLGSRSAQFDRYIHGYKVEIKFSTLWKAGGYTFQQVRDQDYDLVICLGISPFDAHCWVLPKEVLREHVIGHTGQHGGRTARDTAWFSVDPNDPADWLSQYGGRLRDAYRVVVGLGPGPFAR